MGLVRDFFSGYAHGSNKAAQARIEKKIDDLSNKIDSSQSKPASKSEDYGEFATKHHQHIYKHYCRKAREAESKGDTKMVDHYIKEAEDFDRRKGIGR